MRGLIGFNLGLRLVVIFINRWRGDRGLFGSREGFFVLFVFNLSTYTSYPQKEIKDEVGKQIFHNDIVDFKDILRTCLCDPDDSSDIEKKVKRLKDKIHRHQIKLKEKTGREEEKRRRAKKEAQNRQKKELMKLKKTMESGELLEGEKLKMYEALSALNEEK